MEELYLRGLKIRPPAQGEEVWFDALPAVQAIAARPEGLPLRSPVTFFAGENGTGKSTLLEAAAMACGFNAEGGGRNFCFATQETHSSLDARMTAVRGARRPRDGFFLRAESFYNVATEIDRLDELGRRWDLPSLYNSYGGKSLHVQSHGESFLALVLHRFGGEGLYLLDEPEAALSPMRQMTLLRRMIQLAGKGAQFLVSTHSPILLACPDAQILVLDDAGITPTPYEQTEHYRITRRFLQDPQGMLRLLLAEENDETTQED